MTRTNRTRRWRKATVLALCVVYGLVLLHPTTPDAAVTPLEGIVIGTTVASFLLNAYRSSGPDVTGKAVMQNRRMLKELHARFDTFGHSLAELGKNIANIPKEVARDVNQALAMYRLDEVNALRTLVADCAEQVEHGEKCDKKLDQLWTDYSTQATAFLKHGGLAAIELPELYEFERWFLYVTKNDTSLRLQQVNDRYEAAVRKALTEGRLREGMKQSTKLKDAYETAMESYRELDITNCGYCAGESRGDEEATQDKWRSRTNAFASKTEAYKSQAEWYSIYKEVVAALLVFSDRRLGVDLSPYISWQWPTDRRWTETLVRLSQGISNRTPTKQCWCVPTQNEIAEEVIRNRPQCTGPTMDGGPCDPASALDYICRDMGNMGCESIHW